MGVKSSIQDLAFEIAKRTWLKRTISVASLGLTVFTSYHRLTSNSLPGIVQDQTDRPSNNTNSNNEITAADRSPSSVGNSNDPSANFRSSDEVFFSRTNEGNSAEAPAEQNGSEKTVIAGTPIPASQQRPLGTAQTNLSNPSRSENSFPSNNNTSPENSASGSSAGITTAYSGGNAAAASNPVAQAIATSGSPGGSVLPASGPSPTVSSIHPSGGASRGGTAITLTGSNFRSGDSVSLGGSLCLSVQVVSPTQLTCTSSFHASQSVNVTVTDQDGFSATIASAYNYQPSSAVQAVSFAGGSKTGAFGDIEATSITQNTSVIIAP